MTRTEPASPGTPALPRFTLRAARPDDTAGIVELIRGLADYERLTHLLQVTPESLAPQLFGKRPAAECRVAEWTAVDGPSPAGTLVGFALFFTNFSTFLAKPGIYLEDLYVQPAHRGDGIGTALLQDLARLAVQRGCGRFEWCVLDWNEPARAFYRKMGAQIHTDWQLCRVTGEALQALGAPPAAAA